jgi:RNA polymerase sigma-70 factor, ECF subfamily
VFLESARIGKKPEQIQKGLNIPMEGPGSPIAAELTCGLPLLDSSGKAEAAGLGIEQEVIGLFEQYRNALLRYAISFGVPAADGEEIVQEVFLQLFRHLQRGRSRQNLRGWIFCVAHHLTLNRRYANQRMPVASEEQAGIAARRADPGPNPEDACGEAQRRQQLRAVVRALPDVDQACLRMRAEGLRYREIARALGISLGSVSMSLARSLGKLTRADRR